MSNHKMQFPFHISKSWFSVCIFIFLLTVCVGLAIHVTSEEDAICSDSEHHYDAGFYSWQNHSDAENFFEVGHVEEKPGIDKLVEFASKKNNCPAYTELILPEDSQYTYAVSMEKENGYLLELYFTAAMDDGTYFLVTCCYNPMDTASRYDTQTAVFSMETQ